MCWIYTIEEGEKKRKCYTCVTSHVHLYGAGITGCSSLPCLSSLCYYQLLKRDKDSLSVRNLLKHILVCLGRLRCFLLKCKQQLFGIGASALIRTENRAIAVRFAHQCQMQTMFSPRCK